MSETPPIIIEPSKWQYELEKLRESMMTDDNQSLFWSYMFHERVNSTLRNNRIRQYNGHDSAN